MPPEPQAGSKIVPWSYKINEAKVTALTEPFAVWLPNALIDGAGNEVAPLERIRQTRSLPALQLLIELYSVQFLPNYGGVPRDLLKVVFDRAKVGQQGPFVVWGFWSKHLSSNPSENVLGPHPTSPQGSTRGIRIADP
jgi:hypothetical protein